jgi:NADPH2:quinone reductase
VQAIVHEPTTGLRITDVPEPEPRPDELLLDVHAAALNYLDVAYRDEIFEPGAVPGVDAAGVVVAPAADGSGPPAGTRIATFAMGGAWAQRRAVATADVAVVPDGVELAVAAALPAAGITALRAVRRLGPLLGRRVLVTGASGGVGRCAVQLAALAGAEVVAAVGSAARGEGLAELGARQVVTDLADVTAPVHCVLDNVGGPLLAEAFALLSKGGLALSIGQASGQPTTIDFEQARRRGGATQLEAFTFEMGIGPDLAVLLDLVARGDLDPQIGLRENWRSVTDVAEALLGRWVPGKAVLEIG